MIHCGVTLLFDHSSDDDSTGDGNNVKMGGVGPRKIGGSWGAGGMGMGKGSSTGRSRFLRNTNAYMLVYVRERDLPDVMLQVRWV